MPDGEPSLNAAIQLTDNNYQLTGYLVDPNGQPLDEQSNGVFDADDNLLGYGQSMQFFHGAPQGGLWTLTLLVSGPVAGQHLREPFTGAITFAPPPVTTSGIPGSQLEREGRAAGDGDDPDHQHRQRAQGLLRRRRG